MSTWNGSRERQCPCNGIDRSCQQCHQCQLYAYHGRESQEMSEKLDDFLDERIDLEHGLAFLLSQGVPDTDPNVQYHIERLAQVNNEIDLMMRSRERIIRGKKQSSRNTTDVQNKLKQSLSTTETKKSDKDAVDELVCVMATTDLTGKKLSVSKTGPDASLSRGSDLKQAPSKITALKSNKKRRGNKCCEHCGNTSRNLMQCAGCQKVEYCSHICQKSDWKAHKMFCKARQRQREPALTWTQLESYGSLAAGGKYLEVKFVHPEAGLRLVAQCRDAVGDYRRVAAYTSSCNIPNFVPGKTLRWRNPRYHYFMDGTGGVRIEDEDLEDIQIM